VEETPADSALGGFSPTKSNKRFVDELSIEQTLVRRKRIFQPGVPFPQRRLEAFDNQP
jgi:hypothetical protein